MKQSEIHDHIKKILDRIQINNQNLSVHTGKFSQLETDLLRKQCIELYDLINQLHIANVLEKSHNANENSLNTLTEKTEVNLKVETEIDTETSPVIETKKVTEMPVIVIEPEPKLAPLEVVKQADFSIQNDKSNDLIVEHVKLEEELQTPQDHEIQQVEQVKIEEVETKIDEEEVKANINETQTSEVVSELKKKLENPVFDVPKFVPITEKPAPVIVPPKKVVVEERSVLERISEQQVDKSIHKNISFGKNETELFHDFANSKIAKIKDAIDISKRFEIQTRLFGEDSNAYNISINELENAGTHEGALNLFQTFAKRYHWNSDDELVNELKSFIYRKYRDS